MFSYFGLEEASIRWSEHFLPCIIYTRMRVGIYLVSYLISFEPFPIWQFECLSLGRFPKASRLVYLFSLLPFR